MGAVFGEGGAAERLEFDVGFRTDNARRELDQFFRELRGDVPSDAFGEVADDLEDVADSARRARDETKQLKDGFDESAEAGGSFERVMLGVADILEVVGLDAAAAGTRLGADLGGGLEGVIKGGKELIPFLDKLAYLASGVAVAVAAGVTVWSFFANAEDEARTESSNLERTLTTLEDQLVDLTKDGIEAATDSWDAFKDAAQDVADELKVINGLTTEAQQQGEKDAAQIKETAALAIRAASQRVAAIQTQIVAKQQLADADDTSFSKEVQLRREISALNRDLEEAQQVLADKRAEVERTAETVELLAESARRAAEAERLDGLEARDAERAAREKKRALEELQGIEERAALSTLEGEEAILFARDLQLAKIDELARKAEDLAQAEAARVAVVADAEKQIADLRAAEAERLADLQADAEKRALDALKANVAAREQVYAQHFSAVLSRFDTFVTERIEGERTLGESLKSLLLGVLADELRALAAQFTLKAAAYFVAGDAAHGALYLAGAGAATAGAAFLEAGAAGAFSSGGSSSASASTSAGAAPTEEAARSAYIDAEREASRSDTARSSSGGARYTLQIDHRGFEAHIQKSAESGRLRGEIDAVNSNPAQRAR